MSDFGEPNNTSGVVSVTELQVDGAPRQLPRFDEEATWLTARPVVPIEVAKASGKRRSLLIHAAILLVAALLGAAAAVSMNLFPTQQPSATAAAVEPPARTAQDSDSPAVEIPGPASPRTNDSAVKVPTTKATVKPEPAKLDERVPEKTAKTLAKTREKDKAADLDHSAHRRNVREEPAAHRRKVMEKRPVEVDQPQQATRKRRVRDADQIAERPRDASRIREIFEGQRPF